MTVVIAADQANALDQAAAAVEHGAVIGVPTDTVYGLVCLYSDAVAIDRLFAVKERPSQKALPVLLGEAEQTDAVIHTAGGDNVQALALIDRYWPGPLTLVLPARSHLPSALTAAGDTVGVRLPAHPFLRALARRVGPLASSSANRSGQPPLRHSRSRARPARRPHPPSSSTPAPPPSPSPAPSSTSADRSQRSCAKAQSGRKSWLRPGYA